MVRSQFGSMVFSQTSSMACSQRQKFAAVLFLMWCLPHLEQSKLTQQFDNVLFNIILTSMKTEEHRLLSAKTNQVSSLACSTVSYFIWNKALMDQPNSPPFSSPPGCLDRLFICPSWARRGYCDSKQGLMKKHCPSSCDFCYGKIPQQKSRSEPVGVFFVFFF